jgi:hypothetical protein
MEDLLSLKRWKNSVGHIWYCTVGSHNIIELLVCVQEADSIMARVEYSYQEHGW